LIRSDLFRNQFAAMGVGMQNTAASYNCAIANEVRSETPMQKRVEEQGRLETIAPPKRVWQVSLGKR